jgi:hypothetical protein
MRIRIWAARIGIGAAIVAMWGCQGPGSSRSNLRAPAANPLPVPDQPRLVSPEYGPAPPLEGPSLDGPSFPSSDGSADPANGFDRKRHTQAPKDASEPNYAGTTPTPIRLDGPIANGPAPDKDRLGYIELPPAP